ncbi:21282_t:CDS:2, partial [Racocetra persica]
NQTTNDESTNEPVSNQVTSSTPFESSSYSNKLFKLDLKDIQLIPLTKTPGKSWNGLQPYSYLMGSVDTST